jgi:two-component system, cell cycle response regulator DivK
MKLFGKWRKEEPELRTEATPFDAGEAAAPAAAASSGQAPLGQNRKILIVDDNDVVLKAFQMKLKSLGFLVFTAMDGSGAVSTARQERPDLIVLDINFPPEVGSTGLQWDGFNIMEWMRRFREVADIPVIVITSGDPIKYKSRALAAGAAAFFQKPINHEDFLIAIRRILGQNKAQPAAAETAG